MKQKYEKPMARDLGQIQNAEGYCVAGSQAHVSADPNCLPGATAIGSYCGFGGTPDPNPSLGCNPGLVPMFNGCNVGYQNASSCSGGDSPL